MMSHSLDLGTACTCVSYDRVLLLLTLKQIWSLFHAQHLPTSSSSWHKQIWILWSSVGWLEAPLTVLRNNFRLWAFGCLLKALALKNERRRSYVFLQWGWQEHTLRKNVLHRQHNAVWRVVVLPVFVCTHFRHPGSSLMPLWYAHWPWNVQILACFFNADFNLLAQRIIWSGTEETFPSGFLPRCVS